MAAIPLTLWSFDRLLARPGWARAGAFLACYLVHLSGGSYLAYMIHVPLLVLALNRVPELVRRGRATWRAEAPVLLATGCACAAALAATFAKYWLVAHRDELRWHSGTASIWGATTLSYLQPSAWNLYSGHWPGGLFRPENSLFPGWLAAGLAIAGAVLFWRRRRHVPAAAAAVPAAAAIGAAGAGHHRWRRLPLLLVPAGWAAADLQTWGTLPGKEGLEKWIPGQGYSTPLALVVLGVAAWLLATRWQTGRWPLSWLPAAFARPWERGLLLAGCATAALASPLFFLPASHLLPGLSAMRVPARFHAFTMFAVVWLAAATFDLLLARARSCGRFWAAGLATGAAVLLAVELAPRPVSWMELPDEDDFPAVYDWLAGQDDVKALLDLPMGDVIADEVLAMYFGTLHWRPVVNGYSAHFPAPHEYARAHAWLLPDEDAREVLPCWGVTHILVHCSRLSQAERRLLARWHAAHAADLVYGGGGDRVYRLPPCGSGTSPSQKRGEGLGRPAVAPRDPPLGGAPASSQPRRP